MARFASEPCYKSSSKLVVIVAINACVPSWNAYFLFFLCTPLIINHKSSLAISLCLASVNSDFPWPLSPHWNAHGLYASLGSYSPLPMSLPSWHWAVRQYFPSVEWRAWHRQFDMISETTANQWCTTHFYSTSLWEPEETRGLSASWTQSLTFRNKYSFLKHSMCFIFKPETL